MGKNRRTHRAAQFHVGWVRLGLVALACMGMPQAGGWAQGAQRLAAWSTGAGNAQEAGAQELSADSLLEEHFVLELLTQGSEPAGDWRDASSRRGEFTGLALVRSRQTATGFQWECDVRFASAGSRVIHVERQHVGGRNLVWRELRERDGRTVVAREDEKSELAVREWVGRTRVDEQLGNSSSVLFPLQVLARARADLAGEVAQVFDPVSRTVETWTLRQTFESPPAPGIDSPGKRWVECLREDGSCAAAWCFQGQRLVAFRWQNGGLLARRIEAGAFEDSWRTLEGPLEPTKQSGAVSVKSE